MKAVADCTIKELEAAFSAGAVSEEFLAACRADTRKAAARLVRRYEKAQAEHERLLKLYAYEHAAWARGHEIVAAVILPHDLCLPKLNDSKKISAKVREELFDEIQEKAIAVGTALIDAQTIDRVNIYQATINGMYEAIFSLRPEPQEVLIDAVPLDRLPMPSESIIKGDAKSASIAAASIIAKVTRDRLMDEYDKVYPEYGFAQHKGYGTAQHIEALKKYGPCPIHRRSFEPVRSLSYDFDGI